MKQLSLSELSQMVQQAIRASLDESFWVKAEIAQIKENYSGHCYLELVEKTPQGDKIVAQSKAMIWSNTYRILKPYFQTCARQNLCAGIKILVRVKVDYHPVFGLSLVIYDIDPAYTVGDLAMRKMAIIKQLQDDGIFDMNHELQMPLVPQKIAIISSETAAGYLDFISHLQNNQYGYHFDISLFPAYMQGEKAETSIIEAFDCIYQNAGKYDLVAIIRGGGSQTDLSCFDSYEIASNVAQFPLPVLTGIGHEQDDSVTDMVACLRMKTPTAAAEYLINTLFEFECRLEEKTRWAIDYFEQHLEEQKQGLNDLLERLPDFLDTVFLKENMLLQQLNYKLAKFVDKKIDQETYSNKLLITRLENVLKRNITSQETTIDYKIKDLQQAITNFFKYQKNKIIQFESTAHLSDPEHILKKGFSITLLNSKPILDASQLTEGEIITTRFYKGEKKSKIIN